MGAEAPRGRASPRGEVRRRQRRCAAHDALKALEGTTRLSPGALAPTSDSPSPHLHGGKLRQRPPRPPSRLRSGGPRRSRPRIPVRLSELIPPRQIRIGLEAATKREAIEALVALLPLPDPARRAEVVAAVLEREAALSTGIGRGVAVPHGKTPAVPGLMAALGTIPGGLPFDA